MYGITAAKPTKSHLRETTSLSLKVKYNFFQMQQCGKTIAFLKKNTVRNLQNHPQRLNFEH